MDEFVKKLIERLEAEKEENPCRKTLCKECKYTNNCYEGEQSGKVAIDNAIKIANELAEEYNNVFCEQQSEYKFISDKYKRETGCGYTYYDLHHAEPFKFCPYCGKKIKVAPYTEGESR